MKRILSIAFRGYNNRLCLVCKCRFNSIMSEQEKSISNLVLGSYAHQMINHSPIPVLTFHAYQIEIPTEDLNTQGIYYK